MIDSSVGIRFTGVRHAIYRGAPGIAILAGRPPQHGERDDVAVVRIAGWGYSYREVLPGMLSVAAPVVDRRGNVPASVAVVYVADDVDRPALGRRVVAAATAVAGRLS